MAAGSLAAVLLGLYMIDCLMNAFPNMIYVTLAGGLIGLEPKQLRTTAATARAGRPWARPAGAKPRRPRWYRATRAGRMAGRITAGGPIPQPGTVFQARGAAERGGVRLAAGPRRADRPDRSRARLPEAAAAMVRLRQRPGLALGQSPRSGPTATRLPPWRWPAGWWSSAPMPRSTGTPWGRPTTAPATTRSGGRSPRSCHGPRRRHGLRRRLPGHGARTAGGSGAGRTAGSPMPSLGTERDYPGHPELVRFCDEARSILADRHRGTRPRPPSCPAVPDDPETSRGRELATSPGTVVTEDCTR